MCCFASSAGARLSGFATTGGQFPGGAAVQVVSLTNEVFTYLNSSDTGIAITDWDTTATHNSDSSLFTPVAEGITVSATGWYAVSYGINVDYPGSAGNIATRVLVSASLPQDPVADAIGPTASADPWGAEVMIQMPQALIHADAGDTIGVVAIRIKSPNSTTCAAGKSLLTVSTA